MKSEEAMVALCEAMRAEYGTDVEFELSLGEMVGRERRLHHKRMEDAQAADLLPLGAKVAAIRLNRSPRAVYYAAERHRKRLQVLRRQLHGA